MSECLLGRRWLLLLGAACAGCGLGGSKPLEPANFLAPAPAPPSPQDVRTDTWHSNTPDDRPGALTNYKSTVDPADSGGLLVVPSLKQEPPKEVTSVSDTVRDNVKTPADVAQQRAGAAATTAPAAAGPMTGPTQGEYMTLGAVVVTVNGNPIYANKVLSDIAPVLAVKAREVDSSRFQGVVEDEVQKQLSVLVRTELEFAAAQRNLDEHDRNLANQLTMQWREQQITQAGGSVEQARSRARADGRDFDDLVQEQYRVEMRRIYFQKKEFPKVQVSADDMRQYYAQHQDQIFTQRAEAKFSMIKIGFDASGGRDQALAKITALRQRLTKGEDFSQIAGTVNDDESLLAGKGAVESGDWIDRGAFAKEKVEDAVWKLKPGETTPVVEDGDAFYIAKLVDKKEGRVRSFEEADVQALIKRALEAQQFDALRDKAFADLQKEAIIYPDHPQIEPVVEMAMQMYPIWTKAKG
jgi:parvulin-like peptidyl-prolyl isomerase